MRYKQLFPVWLGFEICTNNGDFISKIKCLISLGMDLAFYEHSRGRLSFELHGKGRKEQPFCHKTSTKLLLLSIIPP